MIRAMMLAAAVASAALLSGACQREREAPGASEANTAEAAPATGDGARVPGMTPASQSDAVTPVALPGGAGPPTAGTTEVSPLDGMVMVYVPAGDFLMGAADDDPDATTDENPQHAVYLDAFWIDRTEVTNEQFAQFVDDAGYRTDAERLGSGWAYDGDGGWTEVEGADWRHPSGPGSDIDELADHPVVQVSWSDATAYCEWARRRLPTEAQWEKAARGEDRRFYPWGNDLPAGNLLNLADKHVPTGDQQIDDGYEQTAPVGSFPDGSSPYGVLDMAGNVWEWVADRYDTEYYAVSPRENPTGPVSGDWRVFRGGSWYFDKGAVRSSNRNGSLPDSRVAIVGFRCARP